MAEDLFDEIAKEVKAEEGNESTENIEEMDDISWDDVGDELAQQKEMIHESAKPEQPSAKSGVRKDVPNLDFILDIPLKVTVELGRTKLLVNELLQLGQGSVIELNKLAGEPLEVLVNQKLIAKGEAVVVNEKFGVRITDIMTPMERIEQLGE